MLNLLAVVLSIAPGKLSARIAGRAQHWLTVSIPSTMTPKSFLAELLPNQSAPDSTMPRSSSTPC